jgi:phospholipid-binding lipoprotein MlaA
MRTFLILTTLLFSLSFANISDNVAATTAQPTETSEPSEDKEAFPEDEFAAFEDEFTAEFESGEASDEEIFDPLSGYNRAMTRFNDTMMYYVVEPTVTGYRYVVPEQGRTSIHNFLKNLYYPVSFTNNLLQLKFAHAGNETLRFLINSTIGLFGLFDPADSWFGIKAHVEDFGQTLGHYGVGSGFPVVLPFYGQRNLRDLIGTGVDSYADPIYYVDDRFYNTVEPYWQSLVIKGYEDLNDYSLEPEGSYKKLTEDAIDLYPFLRNAYEQHRNKLIKE